MQSLIKTTGANKKSKEYNSKARKFRTCIAPLSTQYLASIKISELELKFNKVNLIISRYVGVL